MKRIKLVVVAAIFGLCCYSCRNASQETITQLDSGHYKKLKFKNGNLETEYEYQKDSAGQEILDGRFITYFQNGTLQKSSFFRQGVRDSINVEYWPNGKISQRFRFSNGNLSGTQYRYDSNGDIIQVMLSSSANPKQFEMRLDSAGNATYISGSPIFFYTPKMTLRRNVDTLKVVNIVVDFDKFHSRVTYSFINPDGRKFAEHTVTEFDTNAGDHFLIARSLLKSVGQYKYNASVELMDGNNQIIAKDSASFVFTVKD